MRIRDLEKFPALISDERAKARIYGEVFSRVEWLMRRQAQRDGKAILQRPGANLVTLKVSRIAIFPDKSHSCSVWRLSNDDGLEAIAKSCGGEVEVFVSDSSHLHHDLMAKRPGPKDLADFGIHVVKADDFVFGSIFPDGIVLTPGLVDTNALPVEMDAPAVELVLVPLHPDESPTGKGRTGGSGRLVAYVGDDAASLFATLAGALEDTSGLHTVFLRAYDGTAQMSLSARMPSRTEEIWHITTKGTEPVGVIQDLGSAAFRDTFLELAKKFVKVVAAMPGTAADLAQSQFENGPAMSLRA